MKLALNSMNFMMALALASFHCIATHASVPPLSVGVCAATASDGNPISLPAVSDAMIRELRAILADVFQNSDTVLRSYLRPTPQTTLGITRLGSDVSVGSYGLFAMPLNNETGVLKIPLKYTMIEIFEFYDTKEGSLPKRFDPFDFRDQSPEAIENRRSTGLGLLLSHFFMILEQKIGAKIAPRPLAGFSSQQIRDLIARNPISMKASDSLAGLLTNADDTSEGGRHIPLLDHISYGFMTEKLDIAMEARDDGTASVIGTAQFKLQTSAKIQVRWIASLLSQLGIELLDSNPVLDQQNHVQILDLDNSAVVVNTPQGIRIFSGAFDTNPESLMNIYKAGGMVNGKLLDQAGLELPRSKTP